MTTTKRQNTYSEEVSNSKDESKENKRPKSYFEQFFKQQISKNQVPGRKGATCAKPCCSHHNYP